MFHVSKHENALIRLRLFIFENTTDKINAQRSYHVRFCFDEIAAKTSQLLAVNTINHLDTREVQYSTGLSLLINNCIDEKIPQRTICFVL